MTDENLDFFKGLQEGFKDNDQSIEEVIEGLLSLESEIEECDNKLSDLQMQRIVLYSLILYKLGDLNEDS